MELFICGNPRLLSGGKKAVNVNYCDAPRTVEMLRDAKFVDSTQLSPDDDPVARANYMGQAIHQGKASYHHTPPYNTFLRDGEWPSAGIELETHLRAFNLEFARQATQDMRSNWFHFERDGSLDRSHNGEYGYELITCPLPPRAYRDQRLWLGLQNLCNPYLQSFQCEETGLHVHVGLNQFEKFDAIPFSCEGDRRSIGKLLSTVVYYCIADQAFVDRVALRKPTGYCGPADVPEFTDARRLVDTGTATGAALVDYCAAVLMRHRGRWGDDASHATARIAAGRSADDIVWIGSDNYLASGHGTEINQGHQYTIEFRRAKGTMHALSIHRIVELMTSIVRFAGKLCREPDFVATRESFMDWLISTTTSEALRNLAKQTKG